MPMLAGATLRSLIELVLPPNVTNVVPRRRWRSDLGGERRSRDAKSADIHQILVARRAGVGGEVGDGILAKARQELEDVVAAPPPSESLPAPPFSVSLPAPPTRRLTNALPVSDRPVAPAFARRNSISEPAVSA